MKFEGSDDQIFFPELKKKVEQYFVLHNNNRYANLPTVGKGVLLLAVYIASYFLLYLRPVASWQAVLLSVTMGFSAVMIVFNIVHDASHRSLFKNQVLNRWVVYVGDLAGMNTYIWNYRHNIQHHTFTNVTGGDILLDNIPLLRISPYQKRLRIHHYQPLYAPLLYAIYSLFWVFVLDISFFFRKDMGNLKNMKHPKAEWIKLVLFKSFYILYMLVIPSMVLGNEFSKVLSCFLICHVAAGLLLSVVVVLGHCVEGPQYVHPTDDGKIMNSWVQHEWETTSDYATSSKACHWITGGLNTHLAHHLFPKVCHAHYYAITQIIREHCREHAIHYPHYSFPAAIRSHFRFLRQMADK